MIELLTNYIFAGILAGTISVILFYLDSKITKKKLSKLEYFKIFIIATIINGLIIYIMKMNDLLNIKIIKKQVIDVKDTIESNYPNF